MWGMSSVIALRAWWCEVCPLKSRGPHSKSFMGPFFLHRSAYNFLQKKVRKNKTVPPNHRVPPPLCGVLRTFLRHWVCHTGKSKLRCLTNSNYSYSLRFVHDEKMKEFQQKWWIPLIRSLLIVPGTNQITHKTRTKNTASAKNE